MATLTAVAGDEQERAPAAQIAAVPDVVGTAAPVDIHALYTAHWRYLVRLAVLLVDDVASAEDVVQDAFIALHRRAGRLRDPDAALAYLRTSVLNLSRSVLRRRQVARKHLRVAEPDAGPGADHDVLAARRAPGHAARGAPLPRHQREVLLLRYWSGLSEKEIAQTLGISAGSVKSAASRGLATLQRVLGGEHMTDDELERLLRDAFDAQARAARRRRRRAATAPLRHGRRRARPSTPAGHRRARRRGGGRARRPGPRPDDRPVRVREPPGRRAGHDRARAYPLAGRLVPGDARPRRPPRPPRPPRRRPRRRRPCASRWPTATAPPTAWACR